ncbi:872_t:CDS:2 [Ambispora gerdemannii]|uniref:872_t:CDS:1 n=1 Tax=Ambispora gerdemannii TaxID=144530 RepID=A0A9N9CMJ2_9GLOM|nr:872_t:CDS:2 [Ambispora gerdemannii]
MSMVATRERRANAGNRMYELLQRELELDEMFMEVENDEEFDVNMDEDDVFDSDFDQSSGAEDEANNDDAEQQILMEEKKEKKAAKKKILAPLGPVLRNRKRLEEKAIPTVSAEKIASMPGADEYMIRKPARTKKPAPIAIPVLNGVRSSSRRQTAQLPKREKPVERPKTQEELLEEAKITEEENLRSLREFQLREAEKIEMARPFRKNKIEGPFIRDISYIEGDDNRYRQKKLIMEVSSGEDGKNISRELTNVQWWNGADGFGDEEADKRQARKLITFEGFSNRECTELFEEWRQKPQKVKKCICPFTGLTAKYKDPETGIPYATVDAYKKLQRILSHEFVWSPILNAYVHAAEQRSATGTPEGFAAFSVPQEKPRRERRTR